MERILIIEDHENLSQSLKELLSSEGYGVTLSPTLQNAKAALAQSPDLLVLDWMLPDGQGLDFLTEIRKQNIRIPVIFLTARAQLVDKVLGLEMGADDYLTKPFESRELLARIRVQLRKLQNNNSFNKQEPNALLKVGSLEIDRIRHTVTFKNVNVDLVKKEFELLLLLAESPGKVFSRDEILNKVWGYDIFPTTRTVDTHVMLLRQKLQNELIETVRSVGYRFNTL